MSEELQLKIEDINFYKGAFLNAKGFGGNNASALIISPEVTKTLIKKRHTSKELKAYSRKLEATKAKTRKYNKSAEKGNYRTVYKFNNKVLLGENDLEITKDKIKLKGYKKQINLKP